MGPSQAAFSQEGGKTDVSHPPRVSPPVAKEGSHDSRLPAVMPYTVPRTS